MTEQGQGDYTCDRERWQSVYRVDSLADAIDAWKQAGQDERVLLRMLKADQLFHIHINSGIK